MTKFLLTAVGVLTLAAVVFALLFFWQRKKAKGNKDLYEAAKRRNLELSDTLGKLQAAEIIRQEERKNAEEKIGNAYSGNARERFDAINNGLRDNAG
ncbi:MAG: hypothetical protein NC548_31030 [Lachnospiraceae bacterium]|nr:hypothetical protein [Lachnospiraceae bacterium]MCM1232073.1 hypothetical protein [Ruminococcus flavefaciens]